MSAFGTSFGLLNAAMFAGFLSRVVPGVNSAIDDAAQEIIDVAEQEIQSRLYPGHGYLASALHNSYHGECTKSGADVVSINISTDLYYAPCVEYRWEGGEARFWHAMNVVEEKAPEIIRALTDGALVIG